MAHTTHYLRRTCAGLMAAVALFLAGCPDGGSSSGAEQPKRKPLPMEGFRDEAGVEARYSKPAADPAAIAAKGRELMLAYRQGQRCANCHAFPGSDAMVGPSLYGAGSRYARNLGGEAKARVWLHNKIWDPTKFPGLSTALYARSEMPPGKSYYTEDEIAAMVEYLVSLPPKQ